MNFREILNIHHGVPRVDERMLVELFAIIAGLVLLTGVLGVIPALGEHLEKLAKWLGSFQTIIGIIALILGILNLGSLSGIMLVVAGLVLCIGILPAIPALGEHLEKLAKILAGFQVPIGVITLIVGIIESSSSPIPQLLSLWIRALSACGIVLS